MKPFNFKGLVEAVSESVRKEKMIKAMITSGISKKYIAELRKMNLKEVEKEFADFCRAMKD